MNEAFWDDRYRTQPWLGSGPGSRGIAQAFKARLLKIVMERNPVSSIADIGCGDLCWLRADVLAPGDLGDVQYCGFDISNVVLDANRVRFPDLDFRRYDLVKTPLPGGFDLVLCFDVLIHQIDRDQFRRALRNLLTGVRSHALVSYKNPANPACEILPELKMFDTDIEDEFQRRRREARAEGEITGCPTADHGSFSDWVEHISPNHRVRQIDDYRYQTVYEVWCNRPLDLAGV